MRRAALALLLLASCSSQPRTEDPPPPPTPVPSNTFYVAPSGNDQAKGSADDPFRSIGRAIREPKAAKVVIAAGRYPEADLKIIAPIELAGPGDGKAGLDGHLSIQAPSTNVHGLDITAGLLISSALNVVVEAASIGGGTLADAVAIDHSRVELRDLKLSGGSATTLHVTTSTVRIERSTLGLEAGKTTNRGLFAESSSVTARSVTATGYGVANMQVGSGGTMHLLDSRSEASLSLGVAVLMGSTLKLDRTTVSGAADTGVLISASTARLNQLSVPASLGTAIGIAASDVTLTAPAIEPCVRGGITLNNSTRQVSRLLIDGGTIHHGAYSALNIGGGLAIVRGTHFSGDPKVTGSTGDDAISAFGTDAMLRLEGAFSDAAAGFAVGLYNGVTATVSITITRPHLGGITIEASPGTPVVIRNSSVDSCKSGSGIAIFDSTEVTLDGVTVRACPDAGLLAGESSVVRLSNGTIDRNRRYGIGAFGGSEVTVNRTAITGSTQAIFATCADGARVIDAGDNTFKGTVTSCP